MPADNTPKLYIRICFTQ